MWTQTPTLRSRVRNEIDRARPSLMSIERGDTNPERHVAARIHWQIEGCIEGIVRHFVRKASDPDLPLEPAGIKNSVLEREFSKMDTALNEI